MKSHDLVPEDIRIRRVCSEPPIAESLADVLLVCVEGGATIFYRQLRE